MSHGEPRKLRVVAKNGASKWTQRARRDALRTGLEWEGACREVKRLEEQLAAARDLAKWNEIQHKAALLVVRQAMENER